MRACTSMHIVGPCMSLCTVTWAQCKSIFITSLSEASVFVRRSSAVSSPAQPWKQLCHFFPEWRKKASPAPLHLKAQTETHQLLHIGSWFVLFAYSSSFLFKAVAPLTFKKFFALFFLLCTKKWSEICNWFPFSAFDQWLLHCSHTDTAACRVDTKALLEFTFNKPFRFFFPSPTIIWNGNQVSDHSFLPLFPFCLF